MRESGFDVTVISSPGPELDRVAAREHVDVIGVPMARAVLRSRDVIALGRLLATFRALKPDIVNASTPKAALLGMLAARAVDVPVRIYLMRGLRLETTRGLLRGALSAAERVTASCAHRVACVSSSLLAVAVRGGYVPQDKATVVGAGTSNGVDVERFRATEEARAEGARLLEGCGVGTNDPVIGFVGRLVEDKGIRELLDAFARVRATFPQAKLVLLGGDLGDERLDAKLVSLVRASPNVITTPTIAELAPYYARMTVLAFPSHREGFPNVPLEAAAAGVPVVGARSTGVVDAVVHGETGELVDRGDAEGLAGALHRYLSDPARSAAHGQAGRDRVVRLFSQRTVWSAWLETYRELMRARMGSSRAPSP
jgi:glycosyltransferase involved in cell wall biosynthesis